MKKYFLTACVALAFVVNARQPWEKSGPGQLGRQTGEQTGVEYSYQRGDVQFNASWGTAHNNQMLTYQRTDIDTGWRYENGTFNFTSDYVWTDFASRIDVRNNQALGAVTEFGYYKIVDGQAGAPQAITVADGDIKLQNTVIFEKGDTIGFYMKVDEATKEIDHYEHVVNGKTYTSDKKNSYIDENGRTRQHNGTAVYKTVSKTYTTTPGAIEGASVFVNNVDTDSRGLEDQYFCLFPVKIDGVSHYEYYLAGLLSSSEGQSYEDFINDVIENHPDATITDSNGDPIDSNIGGNGGGNLGGQPLPGLLITLVIGGTAVTGLAKKRKKFMK